ncbi:hypothetical protein ACFX2K_034412 [Malus domestica]
MQGKTCPFLVDINGDLYALAGSPASLIASSAFELLAPRSWSTSQKVRSSASPLLNPLYHGDGSLLVFLPMARV